MQIFTCGQRRCRHKLEADQAPETCPRCKAAFAGGRLPGGGAVAATAGSGVDWSEYSKAELLAEVEAWGIEGVTSRTKKADIIAALQDAE